MRRERVTYSLLVVVRRASLALAMGLALLVLFLPTVGPLLDQHFAERYFNHAHLYLGSPRPHHLHFYQELHARLYGPGAVPISSDNSTRGSGDGIVYLTSYDGAGSGGAYISLSQSQSASLALPGPDENGLLLGFSGAVRVPPEAFVPPPDKPPQNA
jgi:hypothetical protein